MTALVVTPAGVPGSPKPLSLQSISQPCTCCTVDPGTAAGVTHELR